MAAPSRIEDMASSGANGVESGVNGKSSVLSDAMDVKPTTASTTTDVNGFPSSTLPNGISKPGHEPIKTGGVANGISSSSTALGEHSGLTSSLLDLPPEIIHSLDGFIPLPQLIERVCQQSFLDFTDLIDKTSEMTVDNLNGSHPGVNGVGSQDSDMNQKKKLLWLDWVNSNREKFIKLMVLSQWTRTNGVSIQKLIALMGWANTQNRGYELAAHDIGDLKIRLYDFRAKNPDISTALEILATGKDSRYPDVSKHADYIRRTN